MKRDKQLRRLSDGSLSRELEYTRRQCANARQRLEYAERSIINNEPLQLPIWLLQSEYADHLAWLETISFEIEYRRIP